MASDSMPPGRRLAGDGAQWRWPLVVNIGQMGKAQTRRGFLKTNRLQLFATTDEWCSIAERTFDGVDISVYCHRSAQTNLRGHAARPQ